MIWLIAWTALVTVTSLLSFALYGWDKRQARRAEARIPEKTLHLLALVGGWPGAWAAQRTFRHKTRKRSFQLIFWATVLLHIAAVVFVFQRLTG